MESRLTIKEQIQVLENIDWHHIEVGHCGLCNAISYSIEDLCGDIVSYNAITDYMPLFTLKNAEKFGANDGMFWWLLGEDGLVQRRRFVKWMTLKLKTQLNK